MHAKPLTAYLMTALTIGAFGALPAAAAPPSGAGEFAYLAMLFSEAPSSSSDAPVDTTAYCGLSGHCSEVSCGCSDCPAGKVPSCSCSASGATCEDKHDPLNPFDNDEHPTYSTSCTCIDPPPPPSDDCLVDDPIGGGCLVHKPASCNSTGFAVYDGSLLVGDPCAEA